MKEFRPGNPPRIPDYTLLRPIGRGAYGEVWLARNVMGTLRAIKIIWRAQFESERPFEREFAGIQRYEPVSRTSGGLVHVLHVGRNDAEGYFFYVMELADPVEASRNQTDDYKPRTLRSDLNRSGALPPAATLRLAFDVVSGLAQLHRRGLVHRDVKPGNIIYVNDRAKLADIGLVSAGGEGRTFVGTEGYIPPEGPGTPAADLFALGMVLYEASTGFPPQRFPDIPSEWMTSDAGDDALELHEVVLKACEGQRERRYRDAEEMQADLALLQSGQSVRQMRALKMRYVRLRASVVAGTTLLVCALLALFLLQYRARVAAESEERESGLRQKAQEALARSESAERAARGQLYNALLEQALATVRSSELGQRVRALEAIQRAAALTNTAELRGAALAALALPDLRLEKELALPEGTTVAVVNRSFDQIAVCRGELPVQIRALPDGRLLSELEASTKAHAFSAWWSHDNQFLAIKRDRPNGGPLLEVWNVPSHQRTLVLTNLDCDGVAFDPKLPRVIAASPGDDGADIWDVASGERVAHLPLPNSPSLLAFSPDGERFAASYYSPTHHIAVHRTATGAVLSSNAVPDTIFFLEWDPRGRWVSCADGSGAVRLIDPQTGEAQTLGRHKTQAALATFSPDGHYLISGGWERECICWDLKRMERALNIELKSFQAHFSADGRQCAIITDENERKVQIHAFEQPSGFAEFEANLGPRLRDAAFSADGRWLAASASQRIGVWNLASPRAPALIEMEGGARLFFTETGDLYASGESQAGRWRLSAKGDDPPKIQRLPLEIPPGFSALCVLSNRVILTSTNGSTFLDSGSCAHTIAGINGVSPDGRWLGIFAPFSTRLVIYALPGFEPVATLTSPGKIASFTFFPTGDHLAINSHSGVEIYETKNWTRTRALPEYVALLPALDGEMLWLTSDYRTAGLYESITLAPVLSLPPGTLPSALSPNRRFLASSLDGRHLRLWDLSAVRQELAELGLNWRP